ncbi:YadA-like family protein [Pseudomonas sp. SCB32]|uniref:YadA-like family protein n=1 Tax=Pseudomonas sp. SCB32 TaxID=2653853 RepID=UPI002114FBDE|nr:YadA-like family protein [Pseudomonas sp. SCB32]
MLGSIRALLAGMVGSLSAVLLSMAGMEAANAGPAYKAGGGTYDSVYTDYYQYAYRTSSYAPTKAWDNQYALGSYVSLGAYASTKTNDADDKIFKLDGYTAGGRGGGVAVGDSATVVGETGVAIGAHSQALRNFSLALGGNALANGLGAIATGREALANGNYSIAQGFVATATGTGAIGLGQSATASGLRSIAIGTSSQLSSAGNTVGDATYLNQATNAAGADAVSIGTGASSAANNSLALGVRAATTGTGTNGVAIGNGSKVSANNGIAIGNGSVASGVNSLSVGTGNQVSGSGSGAFGDPTIITGNNSYSVGNDNNISGSGSFAFGNTNVIQANNSAVIGSNGSVAAGQTDVFALGNNIVNTVSNSVALGSNSSMISAAGATTAGIGRYDSATVGGRTYTFAGAAPVGVVSMGSVGAERRVQNVAAGQLSATSTDATNGSQLFATNQQTTENTNSINTLDGRMTAAEGTVATHTGQIGALQQNALQWNAATGAYDASHGSGQSQKISKVAAGDLSAASSDAVNGSQLFATNEQVAQNTTNISSLDQRVTTNEGDISNLDARTAQNTADIASNATSITNLDGRVTTVEGDISTITSNLNSGTIGLVQQSAAGENLTVGKDTDGAAVDFAGTAGARKLINVADGAVAKDSKDAVNGGQLFGVSQSVANAMGGGSVVNADGSISAPSYTVTNADGSTSTINNMGDAISNIDSRVYDNTTSITGLDGRMTTVEGDISTITSNLNSGTIGLVQQSAAGENLTVGKDTDGAAVDFAGTAGARKLINVADGAVAKDSKDAVNGGQLFTTNEQVVQNTLNISSLDQRVTTNEGDISSLDVRVTNNEGSIGNLDARTIQNTADIAGNTASITHLDGRVTNVEGDIATITNNLNSGTIGLVQQTAAGENLTVGKGTDGAAVDFAGTAGARKLINVADGAVAADSKDAVNGGQLFETNNKVAVIDGRVSNLEGSVMNIANGGGIKYFHTASAKDDSVASGADSIAAGGNAKASGAGAIAMGADAQASADGSIALGSGSSDNGRGAENYTGKYSGQANATTGTVSVGNAATGETRTLSNVADAKEATDAVNLRQLDGAVAESKSYTDSKVEGMTGKLDGAVTDLGKRVNDVDSRIVKVADSVSDISQVNNASKLPKPTASGTDSVAMGAGAHASGANSTAMGSNAKAKGKNSVAIGANSVAERDNSVAVGSAGNERQITHVAAGTERTDAANVGQVNDALQALSSQSAERYNDLKRDLSKQDDELSAGIAGAIAIASLSQPIVNGGSTTAVGVGHYNGQSAVSVGVSHMSNDGKWTTKLGGSTDTQGRFSAGGSVGYNW